MFSSNVRCIMDIDTMLRVPGKILLSTVSKFPCEKVTTAVDFRDINKISNCKKVSSFLFLNFY